MRNLLERTGLAVLASLWLAAQAPAQGYVISSGADDGNYYEMGTRLQIVLNQMNHAVELLTSEGSMENLARLDDPESPVNVAFSQADAALRYLEEHPGFREEIELVDDVGEECVILIVPARGGIANAGDLKKPSDRTLSVGGEASGAAVTYDVLTRLDPAFGNTEVVFVDVLEAMLKLRLGAMSSVGAVMLVSRPTAVFPAVEVLLAHPQDFRVAPVRPEDVPLGEGEGAAVPVLPDGSPIYHFDTVTTGFGKGRALSYATVCTRGLLLASRPKLNRVLKEQLERAMLENGSLIAPARRAR